MRNSIWKYAYIVVGLPFMAMGCVAGDAAEESQDSEAIDGGEEAASGDVVTFPYTSRPAGGVGEWRIKGSESNGVHTIMGTAAYNGVPSRVVISWSNSSYVQKATIDNDTASQTWKKIGSDYKLQSTTFRNKTAHQNLLREFVNDLRAEGTDNTVNNVPDMHRRLNAQECILSVIWFGGSAGGMVASCLAAETGIGALGCGAGLVSTGRTAVGFADACF